MGKFILESRWKWDINIMEGPETWSCLLLYTDRFGLHEIERDSIWGWIQPAFPLVKKQKGSPLNIMLGIMGPAQSITKQERGGLRETESRSWLNPIPHLTLKIKEDNWPESKNSFSEEKLLIPERTTCRGIMFEMMALPVSLSEN